MELAYRDFLAPFGSPSQIVCVAFVIRVIVLTCSLPGLLVTLTGSYRPRGAAVVCDAPTPVQPDAAERKHDLAIP